MYLLYKYVYTTDFTHTFLNLEMVEIIKFEIVKNLIYSLSLHSKSSSERISIHQKNSLDVT